METTENEVRKPERVECCNRKCRWTGTQDEWDWVPSDLAPGLRSRRAVCPKCGKDAFYHRDRLCDWEKQLIEALKKAFKESPTPYLGVSSADVRDHYNKYRSSQYVLGKLRGLAKWGHVVEIPGPPSRWKPAPEEPS